MPRPWLPSRVARSFFPLAGPEFPLRPDFRTWKRLIDKIPRIPNPRSALSYNPSGIAACARVSLGESANTMKQGSCLGWVAALAVALGGVSAAKAQNLGLGTGSHPASADSAEDGRSGWNDEGSAPRRAQMAKRLGLSARRNGGFDPKIYEARGRELQGQFYEIGGPIDGKGNKAAKNQMGSDNLVLERKGGTQWMIWVGVAGFAGASAATAGYLYMNKAHPSAPPPKKIVVTDVPP